MIIGSGKLNGVFSKLMGLQLPVNIFEFVFRLTKEVVIKYLDLDCFILNIDFLIPQNDMVNISIYDITGRLVQELYNDVKDFGYHSIQWNAINYASGIYFIKILTNNFTQTKKVTLLK